LALPDSRLRILIATGLLARMSEAIAHRGPDGCGAFHRPEHGIGLAHRRLAIIDLSHAADQPMCDEATGLAIVFNGELDNYRELRADGHKPVGWVGTAFP